MDLTIAPQLRSNVWEFTLVSERVVSQHIRVAYRSLAVVCVYRVLGHPMLDQLCCHFM